MTILFRQDEDDPFINGDRRKGFSCECGNGFLYDDGKIKCTRCNKVIDAKREDDPALFKKDAKEWA